MFNFKLNLINQQIINKRYLNIDVKSNKDNTEPKDIFKEIGIEIQDYWENLDNHDIRNNMITHLKYKGGVYIIINKITRNYYIGSASINRLYTRFSNHMLYYNGSKLVKRSILKYGLNNFIFGILEYYPIYNIENLQYHHYRHNLYELETMYISLLTPKYNNLTEAGSSIGYKHTDDTIKKLKASFSKERRLLLSQLQKSRKNNWSELSKHNLSILALNRSNNYLTNKGRENISKVNSNIIKLYNINNEYICKFKNINTTSHYLCCSYKTIQRSLNIGWIYIPNIFISYLNDSYINNNNDIIKNINKEDLYYKNNKNKYIRIKSGLYKYDWNTKFIIKYI